MYSVCILFFVIRSRLGDAGAKWDRDGRLVPASGPKKATMPLQYLSNRRLHVPPLAGAGGGGSLVGGDGARSDRDHHLLPPVAHAYQFASPAAAAAAPGKSKANVLLPK